MKEFKTAYDNLSIIRKSVKGISDIFYVHNEYLIYDNGFVTGITKCNVKELDGLVIDGNVLANLLVVSSDVKKVKEGFRFSSNNSDILYKSKELPVNTDVLQIIKNGKQNRFKFTEFLLEKDLMDLFKLILEEVSKLDLGVFANIIYSEDNLYIVYSGRTFVFKLKNKFSRDLKLPVYSYKLMMDIMTVFKDNLDNWYILLSDNVIILNYEDFFIVCRTEFDDESVIENIVNDINSIINSCNKMKKFFSVKDIKNKIGMEFFSEAEKFVDDLVLTSQGYFKGDKDFYHLKSKNNINLDYKDFDSIKLSVSAWNIIVNSISDVVFYIDMSKKVLMGKDGSCKLLFMI